MTENRAYRGFQDDYKQKNDELPRTEHTYIISYITW